jgi:nitrite reductase/ring-hydroxylating ferredoxin subunit
MLFHDCRDMIPVSLSGGVEPGARTGTSAGGQAVVVWRGQDGVVRAWADRCPHRGMRLSFGFVRENTLTCIYHGWSFGAADQDAGDGPAAGRCLAIPAHPGMTPPAKASVPVLPAAEALGMIWVGTGPDDTRPPLPAVPDPGTVHPVRSVTAPAPAAALAAALEATPPPGTETAETAQDGMLTFKGPAVVVVAAIQDRGDGTSTAHVVSTGFDPQTRQALCRWAALVRDHLAAVVLP